MCVCSFWVPRKEHTTSTSIIALQRNEGAEAPVVYLQLVGSFMKPPRVLEEQNEVVVDSGSLCSSSRD